VAIDFPEHELLLQPLMLQVWVEHEFDVQALELHAKALHALSLHASFMLRFDPPFIENNSFTESFSVIKSFNLFILLGI
jgi:hypothetical protein